MAYTFVDNSAEVLLKLRGAIDGVAEQLKEDLVEGVQEKMLYGYNDPLGSDGHTEIVDTGRLFDSIQAEVKRVSQNTVDINVGATGETNYAVYVHEGTHKLKGSPFITDGVQEKREHIRATLENGLRNA